MASKFGFKIKSVGGIYTGMFPSASSLAGCPAPAEPVSSGNSMQVWGPKVFDSHGAGDEWARYMKDTVRQDVIAQFSEWLTYLQSGGYVSEATAVTVAEFGFVDDIGEPIETQTLCLRAYSTSGSGNMYIFMAKKTVVDPNTNTYNTVSSVRSIGDAARMVSFGITCGRFLRGGKVWYCFGACMLNLNGSQIVGELFTNDTEGIETLFGYRIPAEEYSDDYGEAASEGGYSDPTFDDTSDNIDFPTKPAGVSSLGFVNIYKCDIGSLTMLGGTLFPDVAASTDVWTAITALSDSIWNSKLIDYVISIHMIPCSVAAGQLEDIKIGTRTLTGILARKVSEDYVDVSLGDLKVDEYYTNFADYQTRAKIFLPFYGFVELKPEYWQSATLSIMYRFNVVDGSFVAMVKSTVNRHQTEMSSIVGQYSGCACIHCPTSGVSYASMFGGMVANAGGMAVGLASGNPALAMTSALATAAQAGSGGGQMQHGNPYNASSSIMGQRKAYLLIERPVSHFSTMYDVEKGIPLLTGRKLSTLKGYTEAEAPVLDGIPCTDAERERIRQALRNGVIIK